MKPTLLDVKIRQRDGKKEEIIAGEMASWSWGCG